MHKEARLPSGNPPEPMRGSALVAFQLLVFPHGPLDQNPIKHPEAKQQPARRFADWLVSPEGQAAIGAYKINGEQLFHASADAPK